MVRAKFSGMLMVCIFLLGVIALLLKACRGRDTGYPTPPAQLPACGTTAPDPCLGSDVQAPEGTCLTRSGTCDRGNPALCPAPGLLRHVPLGQLPSLHLLRRSQGRPLFEGFFGPMKLSDSLHPSLTVVPHGFTVRTWHHCQARCRASRVPHPVFPCMPEVSDPARCVYALP